MIKGQANFWLTPIQICADYKIGGTKNFFMWKVFGSKEKNNWEVCKWTFDLIEDFVLEWYSKVHKKEKSGNSCWTACFCLTAGDPL